MESIYNKHGYSEIPAIAKSFLGTEFSPVIFKQLRCTDFNEFESLTVFAWLSVSRGFFDLLN